MTGSRISAPLGFYLQPFGTLKCQTLSMTATPSMCCSIGVATLNIASWIIFNMAHIETPGEPPELSHDATSVVEVFELPDPVNS